MRHRPLVLIFLAAVLAWGAPGTAPAVMGQAAGDVDHVRITTLGNRADLLSGDDALVRIQLPAAVDDAGLRVQVDGRDITEVFHQEQTGDVIGLVEGLPLGTAELTATFSDGRGATLALTNHPTGGPVFAGEQIQPWTCGGDALDEQCNRAAAYELLYYSSTRSQFEPYDPDDPPADVAQTTTDQGRTVDYVVRRETGALDRGQYQIAVLFDPDQPWDPTEPRPAWNRKAYVTHGQGCGTQYDEGTAPDVMVDRALSRGFAVMSSALNITSRNCNLVVQAEATMMLKERLVDRYGEVRYTIGFGGSGGAIAQQWMANAYPGLYDGLIVKASFADAWTRFAEVEDCRLIQDHTSNPSRWQPGVVWSPLDANAVMGTAAPSVCQAWTTAFGFPSLFDPSDNGHFEGCAVPDRYHPDSNPDGHRCTIWDYSVAVLGTRPSDGFAGSLLDNVGVQYGLQALQQGVITPAQFVDLNAGIGGHDIDYNPTPHRSRADADAVAAAYRSGHANQADNLDLVPIIDLRAMNNLEIHQHYNSFSTRARLDRANGHHDNQVIWFLEAAANANSLEQPAFETMDAWLAAREDGDRGLTRRALITATRPELARDRCIDVTGAERADFDDCAVPADGSPRMAAGGPLTDDILSCQLVPLDRDRYPVAFSDAQWARLQEAFPDGVCDHTRPGVGQQATVAWATYTDGPGATPLGPAPRSVPFEPEATTP